MRRRGLGRLLGTRRLLAEGVADAAGCEDHALLLDAAGGCRGIGYNRYRQACPVDDALRLSAPTALPGAIFAHGRLLALAAGGGCSAAVAETRETLAACCVAVLKARLEAHDTSAAVELLALASTCETPALAPLAASCAGCVGAQRAVVGSRLGVMGVDVDEALGALRQMSLVGGAAPMEVDGGVDV